VIQARRYADGGPASPKRPDDDDAEPRLECDACGAEIEGRPAGSGLFLWTRGGEVRYEEPPLCESCAQNIATVGMVQWDEEEEG